MLALLVSTILSEGVIGSELWIHNADEFVEFSNLTDKKKIQGVTIFLDSDIDLSGRTIEPISL